MATAFTPFLSPKCLPEAMGEALRKAAAECVMPRFQHLQSCEIEEKSPGDLVTIADREAEAMIAAELTESCASARLVGEEAAADDPSLLRHLDKGEVWIIDPIDGTGNFASGRAPFALMAALLSDGEIIASAIFDPLHDKLMLAEKSCGAWINGEQIEASSLASNTTNPTGIISHFQRPKDIEPQIASLEKSGTILAETQRCAGYEYPLIALAKHHFALYWRTLVWDHAPGVLFLEEAGGKAAYLDGEPYSPARASGPLLLAHDEATWHHIARAMTD